MRLSRECLVLRLKYGSQQVKVITLYTVMYIEIADEKLLINDGIIPLASNGT